MKGVVFFLTNKSSFLKIPTIQSYGFSHSNPFFYQEDACVISITRELEITQARKTKGIKVRQDEHNKNLYISMPKHCDEMLCFQTKFVKEWMYILVASAIIPDPPIHQIYVPVLYLPRDGFSPKEKAFQSIDL
jgi:hypothetical protein